MAQRAQMETVGHGTAPATEGWFVVHASEALWIRSEPFGSACVFEGGARFPQLGINVHVLEPDQPACLYHRENAQENFLVLSGRCRVLIDDEEHELRAGHFVHCPPGVEHVFVGAGDGPCAILMVGCRPEQKELCYPVNERAAKYGASVETETRDPRVAYGERRAERGAVPIWPAW